MRAPDRRHTPHVSQRVCMTPCLLCDVGEYVVSCSTPSEPPGSQGGRGEANNQTWWSPSPGGSAAPSSFEGGEREGGEERGGEGGGRGRGRRRGQRGRRESRLPMNPMKSQSDACFPAIPRHTASVAQAQWQKGLVFSGGAPVPLSGGWRPTKARPGSHTNPTS